MRAWNETMATMSKSSTEIYGARLLREIAAEECSLEDVCLFKPSSRNVPGSATKFHHIS